MKYLVVFIAFLAFTLFSCNKEEIRPNDTNTTLDHNSKKGDNTGTNTGDGNGDDGGTITDPNNDEDESKKIKKGK